MGHRNPVGRMVKHPLSVSIGVFLITCMGASGFVGHCHAAALDLSEFKLTFNEDFNTLDVSGSDTKTRWTAHTPWGGDFGDARFVDPEKGFPFTVSHGVLRIEARKNKDAKWESGLLSSVNPSGGGFSQLYGYFEMRAKLPPGPGLWPAFWLDAFVPKDSPDPSVEVDVIEHYGKFPANYNSTVTVWSKPQKSEMHIQTVPAGSLYARFHTYGVSIDKNWIIMYFDRQETWRVQTPPEHKRKLMMLLNLSLGSGWPIDEAPSPSYMYVDYVRAYSWRPSAKHPE